MKTTIRVCTKDGWKDTTFYRLRKANVCESVAITIIKEDGGESTTYKAWCPPKPRDMTPPAYYRKYQCVPERYTDRVGGRYYCNPYHCSRSWATKEARDKHLDMAYRML